MHARVDNEWQAFAEPPGGEVHPDGEPTPISGKPLQAFRVGKLYSRRTGELLLDVTDEWLAEVKRVFDATRDDRKVTIDWGHGADIGRTAKEGQSLGEVVALEHRPGRGLWATPAYTPEGAEAVEANGGVLYTSPSFFPPNGRGEVFNASTGAPVGFVQMLGLALTNRPVQDRLETARLSDDTSDSPLALTGQPFPETPADAGTQEAAMADTATASATPADAAAPIVGAQAPSISPEEFAALKTENEGLRARIASFEQANATQAAVLSERGSDIRTLSEQVTDLRARVAKAEADTSAANKARLLDSYQSRGLFADDRRAHWARIYDLDVALFGEEMARLEKHPEGPGRPGVRLTSGAAPTGKSPEDAAHEAITAAAKERGLSYAAATTALLSERPELFAEVQ